MLSTAGLARDSYQSIWSGFTEEYFLRHRPEEIAWHTRVLAESGSHGTITVDVNDVVVPGLTAVAVHSPEETRSFMRGSLRPDGWRRGWWAPEEETDAGQ